MATFRFVKAVLKDFRVGALSVSSKYVVKRLLREKEPHYKFVVEYGAGDGVITKALLRRLPPDGRLVAIELNKDLVSELKEINDSRLTVLHGDVIHLSRHLRDLGLPKIDWVISGVPFTFFPPSTREEIFKNTHAALAPLGKYVVYQYSFLLWPLFKRFFRNIRLDFEPRNFLPYFIMVGRK